MWRTKRAILTRITWMLVVAGVPTVIFGTWLLWNCSDSVPLRAWMAGYDGCLCHDCVVGIVGMRSSWADYFRSVGGVGFYPAEMWWRLLLSGGILLGLAFLLVLLRRAFPHFDGKCPLCRYDLSGLPHRRCPECGWQLTQSTTDVA